MIIMKRKYSKSNNSFAKKKCNTSEINERVIPTVIPITKPFFLFIIPVKNDIKKPIINIYTKLSL